MGTKTRNRIYLDYCSTTPVDPQVLSKLVRFSQFGNPSSAHFHGQRAKATIESARESVADLLHVSPQSIIWTGSATEANNWVLHSTVNSHPNRPAHIIIGATEHSSIREFSKYLLLKGKIKLTECPVHANGQIDLTALTHHLTYGPDLVSIQTVNQETGICQPIGEISNLCRAAGVPFHTDAVQAIGKGIWDWKSIAPDWITLSPHKWYGPTGVGILVCQKPLHPLIIGGHQEQNRRGGTENVWGIYGVGIAANQLLKNLDSDLDHRTQLDRHLRERLLAFSPIWISPEADAVDGIVNVAFETINGDALVMAMDMAGISLSTGSACSTGSTNPSHVLTAMGLPDTIVSHAIRISMGRMTTESEINLALDSLGEILMRYRSTD